MPKAAKITVACLLLVTLLAGIAVAVFVKWDWDKSRPWLNEKISLAIGRQFAIRGHVAVTWHRPDSETGWRHYIPWPRLVANDVVINNPAWAAQPFFATIEQVQFDMGILPLIHHQIDIPSVALLNPAIDLERQADGQVNWLFNPPTKTKSPWDLKLDEIHFAAGQLTVADQINKLKAHAEIRPIGESVSLGNLLDKSAPAAASSTAAGTLPAIKGAQNGAQTASQTGTQLAPYGFAFTVTGTHDKAPLKGSGKFGGVLSLLDARTPFPLQVDLRIGDSHIAAVGTLTDPGHVAALDLQLQLASSSMAQLYPVIGVTLPETPPFSTRGHLTGRLSRQGNVFNYERFSGKVGGSDLEGSLDYRTDRVRPLLSGSLHSEQLLFTDLAPLIGAPGKNTQPAAKKVLKEIPGHAIPATRFRTERWKAMDADIKFIGKHLIRPAALPVNDVSAHLMMNDGVLTLNPLKFGVAGGTLSGNIALDGRRDPMHGKFSLSARGMRLKQLFPTFEPMKTSFGQVNGDADLSATGNAPAELAASMNGEIKMLLNDGAISRALLEQAGLNVANIVLAKLFGDEIIKINCAAADFNVKKGLLMSRVLALDTVDALINVEGTVNLGTENMDLHVYPHTKGFRIFSLRSPLYVKGTFKHPQVGVEVGPLAARGAAAVGLGLLNPFAALLALTAPSNNSASPCPAIVAVANKKLREAPR